MSTHPTHKVFPLPPAIKLPPVPLTADEVQAKIEELVDESYEHAVGKLNKSLSVLDKYKVHKLQLAAEEAGYKEATDYVRAQLKTISTCYIGYRTKLMQIREDGSTRDITKGYISNALTDLSECIGMHTTEMVYRTLASSMDAVMEAHFGKPKGRGGERSL